MRVLFLDESGHANLKAQDVRLPFLIVGGIICDYDYAQTELQERSQLFKQTHLESRQVHLRASDMTQCRGCFGKLSRADIRIPFYSALNSFVAGLEFHSMACAVDKNALVTTHSVHIDPYALALEPLLERFYFDLRQANEKGKVILESRSRSEDAKVYAAFQRVCFEGTRFERHKRFREWIDPEPVFRRKSDNLPGLEISDLMLNSVGRYVMGREAKVLTFQTLHGKLRRCAKTGQFENYGLIRLP